MRRPKKTLDMHLEDQLMTYIQRHHQYHRNQVVQTELSWLHKHFPVESKYIKKDSLDEITEK